jgi:hypothetical protein
MIPAGCLDTAQEKLFSGLIPCRLINGCVDNREFNADVVRNPFSFQHFSSRELSIYLDGQQLGIKPLTLDFANRENVLPYISLFESTNIVVACAEFVNIIEKDRNRDVVFNFNN